MAVGDQDCPALSVAEGDPGRQPPFTDEDKGQRSDWPELTDCPCLSLGAGRTSLAWSRAWKGARGPLQRQQVALSAQRLE